jgi:hypothetical protein
MISAQLDTKPGAYQQGKIESPFTTDDIDSHSPEQGTQPAKVSVTGLG